MKQRSQLLYRLLLACSTLGMPLSAKAQNFLWARQMGGASAEYGKSITTDISGNTYTTGNFSGTVDFDPGPGTMMLTSTADGGDCFITKLDPLGNLVWARSITGTGFSGAEGSGITIDASGNVLLTGYCFGTLDFDPGPGVLNLSPGNDQSIFVLKLTASGNLGWAKLISGNGAGDSYAQANDIVVDALGNVYTTGLVNGVMDFDPGPATVNVNTAGLEAIFVSKLNSSGDFVWVRPFGIGTGEARGRSLTLDASGNLYMAGSFFGITDFDPGATVFNLDATAGSGVVLKMTALGNFIWARQMGAVPGTIKTDGSGHLYLSGEFSGVKDFDPGPATASLTATGGGGFNTDVFVARWDTAGSYNWAKGLGGSGVEDNSSFTIDQAGNAYICGRFMATADFDPGTGIFNLEADNGSGFIVRLDAAGNFSWAKQLSAYLTDIAADPAGNVYTTGSFSGTVDFDPGTGNTNLTAVGIGFSNADIFIHKTGVCNNSTYSTVTATACDTFPLGIQIYTATGVYHQAFTNAGGCDSIVTLNLTVNNSTGSTIVQSACSSFTLNGQVYTASGAYTQNFTNAAGCDSIVTLQLSLLNNDTLITETACDSFNLNNQAYYTSGTYTQTITNAAGCDSVITLNLTLTTSTVNVLTETSCDSFLLNNQVYAASGTYMQVFTNAAGCDSVLTLHLTVNSSGSSSITETVCDSFVFNSRTYRTSGIYKDTLATIRGCDSIVTLDLTINHINAGVTDNGGSASLTALESGAEYHWIDCATGEALPGATQQSYTPVANGRYAVVILKNGCTDTSACVSISGLSIGNPDKTGQWLQLKPNPTRDKISLTLGHPLNNADLRLLNASGQCLKVLTGLKGKQLTIDLSAYAPGLYIIELHEEGKTVRGKLLKY